MNASVEKEIKAVILSQSKENFNCITSYFSLNLGNLWDSLALPRGSRPAPSLDVGDHLGKEGQG